MKIAVLTSSRADFGIYTPLLKLLAEDPQFKLKTIAFGTHLSERHGMTINEIKSKNFGEIACVPVNIDDSSNHSVALSYAEIVKSFAYFWNDNQFDLVLCLGDRYEMSAAVQAGIPYNVNFCHIHGGEQTLGAIDNIYRHQITLASNYHFTSTLAYKQRVEELNDTESNNVFNIGSLSLSGLEQQTIIGRSELLKKFDLPSIPYILATFHPETVNIQGNSVFIDEMIKSFDSIPESHHLIVTMPNADSSGAMYRNALENYKNSNPKCITLVESFGKDYYFSALSHASFVIGNSSSAIVEAASFGQFVINIGNRQKGRLQSANTIDCEFNSKKITALIDKLIKTKEKYEGLNIYVQENSAELAMIELRKIANEQL